MSPVRTQRPSSPAHPHGNRCTRPQFDTTGLETVSCPSICRMAKLVRHLTLDQEILGSNPSPAAKNLTASTPFPRPVHLVVQDAGFSVLSQGFDSPTGYHLTNPLDPPSCRGPHDLTGSRGLPASPISPSPRTKPQSQGARTAPLLPLLCRTATGSEPFKPNGEGSTLQDATHFLEQLSAPDRLLEETGEPQGFDALLEFLFAVATNE